MATKKPVLNKQATDQKNLEVIRRIDPDVEEVIDTAGHVALYNFDTETAAWARKDVEGTLFVVKRTGQPRFRYIVLNKKSSVDFIEDIGRGFTCEKQSPYLLYRTDIDDAACKVIGIWFFESEDCTRLTALLQRISNLVTGGDERKPFAPATVSAAAPAPRTSAAPIIPQPSRAATPPTPVPAPAPVLSPTPAPVPLPAVAQPPAPAPQPRQPQPPQARAATPPPEAAEQNNLQRMFAALKASPSVETLTPPAPVATAPAAAKPSPAPTPPRKLGGGAGAPLLLTPQLLLRGTPLAAGMPATQASRVESRASSDQTDATVDRATVQALLRSMASNQALCDELARELRIAGLLS